MLALGLPGCVGHNGEGCPKCRNDVREAWREKPRGWADIWSMRQD